MSVIWNKDKISREDFKDECKKIAENQEAIEGWAYPEFSDRAKFDNFLYMMIDAKFLERMIRIIFMLQRLQSELKKAMNNFLTKSF